MEPCDAARQLAALLPGGVGWGQRRRLFSWRVGLTSVCLLVSLACASNRVRAPDAEPEPEPVPELVAPTVDTAALEQLQERLNLERDAYAAERSRGVELERQLDQNRAALAVARERAIALEIELASAIEEVLRSKASVRSVQSRALATSRIAEVRVSLQSVEGIKDGEGTARLERAAGFLVRADEALSDENYSGAAYLAEKASDLVRQARTVTEVQSSIPGDIGAVIPLTPPRAVTPTQRTNLREGPDSTFDRLTVLDVGEPLLAVARVGEWLQIECRDGLRGWVHSRLVVQSEED